MSIASLVSGYIPMLRLGSINFALNTAVYQQMQRTAEYRWPGQERFGQLDALQFTGPGEETMTLPGVIYPEFKGSANAIANFRTLASLGQPQTLLDFTGKLYGNWVIVRVEETRSEFALLGVPRKIEFSITLKRFDSSDGSLLPNLSGTMAGTAINVISNLF
jgi:phage protein U